MAKYVLAIDQGTTSSRVIVLNEKAELIDIFSDQFKQIYQGDAVLQNSEEIFLGVKKILDQAIDKYQEENITAIGITNQGETTVIFDEECKPLKYDISWQSKHTKEICDTRKEIGF